MISHSFPSKAGSKAVSSHSQQRTVCSHVGRLAHRDGSLERTWRFMEGSVWTSALSEVEVSSAGTSQSMLKAAHLTCTRHTHQVTLLALHILQREP